MGGSGEFMANTPRCGTRLRILPRPGRAGHVRSGYRDEQHDFSATHSRGPIVKQSEPIFFPDFLRETLYSKLVERVTLLQQGAQPTRFHTAACPGILGIRGIAVLNRDGRTFRDAGFFSPSEISTCTPIDAANSLICAMTSRFLPWRFASSSREALAISSASSCSDSAAMFSDMAFYLNSNACIIIEASSVSNQRLLTISLGKLGSAASDNLDLGFLLEGFPGV